MKNFEEYLENKKQINKLIGKISKKQMDYDLEVNFINQTLGLLEEKLKGSTEFQLKTIEKLKEIVEFIESEGKC